MSPVQHILQFFAWSYIDRETHEVASKCAELAEYMAKVLPSNPETTVGLRKLLDARDCFVRSMTLKSAIVRSDVIDTSGEAFELEVGTAEDPGGA